MSFCSRLSRADLSGIIIDLLSDDVRFMRPAFLLFQFVLSNEKESDILAITSQPDVITGLCKVSSHLSDDEYKDLQNTLLSILNASATSEFRTLHLEIILSTFHFKPSVALFTFLRELVGESYDFSGISRESKTLPHCLVSLLSLEKGGFSPSCALDAGAYAAYRAEQKAERNWVMAILKKLVQDHQENQDAVIRAGIFILINQYNSRLRKFSLVEGSLPLLEALVKSNSFAQSELIGQTSSLSVGGFCVLQVLFEERIASLFVGEEPSEEQKQRNSVIDRILDPIVASHFSFFCNAFHPSASYKPGFALWLKSRPTLEVLNGDLISEFFNFLEILSKELMNGDKLRGGYKVMLLEELAIRLKRKEIRLINKFSDSIRFTLSEFIGVLNTSEQIFFHEFFRTLVAISNSAVSQEGIDAVSSLLELNRLDLDSKIMQRIVSFMKSLFIVPTAPDEPIRMKVQTDVEFVRAVLNDDKLLSQYPKGQYEILMQILAFPGLDIKGVRNSAIFRMQDIIVTHMQSLSLPDSCAHPDLVSFANDLNVDSRDKTPQGRLIFDIFQRSRVFNASQKNARALVSRLVPGTKFEHAAAAACPERAAHPESALLWGAGDRSKNWPAYRRESPLDESGKEMQDMSGASSKS